MTRCIPCVEKKLRAMIRERDARINALDTANKRLTAELANYRRALAVATQEARDR